MNRYAYIALLTLACGAAADDGAPPTEREPEREVPTVPPAEPEPAPPAVAEPEPPAQAEPEPEPKAAAEPRGCSYDWQCQLRSSVCAPLEVGGELVCRRPLTPEGDECEGADDCELGLVCAWAGIEGEPTRICTTRCYSATDYACTTAKRKPLSCTGERRMVDVSCEVEG